MFSTASIINNLTQSEGLEYKKLCRLLKISKKSDKNKLDIALKALEELEIINKNEKNEYSNVKDKNHIVAKIRCSSKGFCFAVRENNKEDIYIRENLLNYAWNGDKVLVRVIKEAYRRRSPEGIVDCILERTNQILLAKVEIINNQVYGVPIDDRILSKIRLPKEDEKYKYNIESKNIVKIEIDIFPIGQQEGKGHVIKELKLNKTEKYDVDFVLSKSNIYKINKAHEIDFRNIKTTKRLDLTSKNSYMFKSWNNDNSPLLPIIQIDESDNEGTKLWLHTNTIAERLDLSNKKIIELLFNKLNSFPLLEKWDGFLSENIINPSRFVLGENNEAISLCMNLNKENEIINWSFHLTLVKCTLVVENKHTEALSNRKNKTRISSRVLKPIKEHIGNLDKILDLSKAFREKQILGGKFEISSPINGIDSLNELYVHNPVEYSKEYLTPLNSNDCQTYLSPILFEADAIWFNHSNQYGLISATFIPQQLEYINVSEIIKYSELVESNLELDENGSLTVKQLVELCDEDEDKKRILHKLFISALRDNEVSLTSNIPESDYQNKTYISPWTMPSNDFINLINQYNIYKMIVSGKVSNKEKNVKIMEKDSWKVVDWNIFSAPILKNMNLLFNNYVIDRVNEYKNKTKQFNSNIIALKQVREAEKLIEEIYVGFIISVQSYGFFVEIPDLNLEGLVHVSTLNNDWFEYRSRQNLLIGRKSKKSYKIGDKIKIKIVKVDILKYQIDLELI